MAFTLKQEVTLETEECYLCGVVFGFPQSLKRRALDNGVSFFCPNGHSQCYTKSKVQRLEEALAAQTRTATQQAERARVAEVERDTARKALVRVKKRVTAGVCMCCNRTFQNLARHMATQHKEEKK